MTDDRPYTREAISANAETTPQVAIVVVNWNGGRDSVECLETLMQLEYVSREIIVVDNGSTDDSVRNLRDAFPSITVIDAGRNLGFAGGCNLAMRYGMQRRFEYFWLINNDATVVPESLGRLVDLAERNPATRFFGSWITDCAEPDRLVFGGGIFGCKGGRVGVKRWNERVSTCTALGSVEETSWITGCSLLAQTKGLSNSDLFDESYFLYFEDLEWQVRCGKGHPRALILCSPLVRHKGGRSTGGSGSELGGIFMSRNYLKLAQTYSNWAFPLWVARWAVRYVLRPLLHLRVRLFLSGLRGLWLVRADGAAIAARFAPRRPDLE